ncbi:hypothetical protein BDV19DRAFT_79190 [Aspergillus venezuelensis]
MQRLQFAMPMRFRSTLSTIPRRLARAPFKEHCPLCWTASHSLLEFPPVWSLGPSPFALRSDSAAHASSSDPLAGNCGTPRGVLTLRRMAQTQNGARHKLCFYTSVVLRYLGPFDPPELISVNLVPYLSFYLCHFLSQWIIPWSSRKERNDRN